MKPNTNNLVAATAAAAAIAGGEAAQADHNTTPLTPATQEAVQILADQSTQSPLTPDSIITLPAPAPQEFKPEKKGGPEQFVPGGPGDSSDVLGTGPVDQERNEAGFTRDELFSEPAGEDGFKPGETPDLPAVTPEGSDVALVNGGFPSALPYPPAQESAASAANAVQEMAYGLGELAAKNTTEEPVESEANFNGASDEEVVEVARAITKGPKPGNEAGVITKHDGKHPPEPIQNPADESLLPQSDMLSPVAETTGPVSSQLADTVKQMGEAIAQNAEAANPTPQQTKAIKNPGE